MNKNAQKSHNFHPIFSIFRSISQKLCDISTWLDRRWKTGVKSSIFGKKIIKIDVGGQKL